MIPILNFESHLCMRKCQDLSDQSKFFLSKDEFALILAVIAQTCCAQNNVIYKCYESFSRKSYKTLSLSNA